MSKLLLFSDASVDSKLETGFGAYLAVAESELDLVGDMTEAGILRSKLKTRQFRAASPTPLEIETALWALQDVMPHAPGKITLYTDSQAIVNLARRRAKLEQSGFTGAGSGKILKHTALYRAFYQAQDRLGFELVKLKGHRKRTDQTRLDRIFSYVDRASRKALREYRQHASEA